MRALVTGGSGCLGRALIDRLVGAGVFCRVFDVGDPLRDSLPSEAEFVRGDVREAEQIRRAVENIDVIFHLAAAVHGGIDDGLMNAVNVQGARNVVQAAVACGARRIVFASTIGIYGLDCGQGIREDHPENPKTPYARSKQAAERVILSASGVENVVLRFPVAYGPFDRGNVARLIEAISRKRFVQFGNARHPRAMISSYRAAEAAVLAAQSVATSGQIIQVADVPHPSLRSLIDEVRMALSVNGVMPRLPWSMGWAAARCCDALGVLTGAALPLSTSVFNKLFSPLSLDCRKAQELLGIRPGCDLAKGIADEVAWLRAIGRVAALPGNGVR
ncbi:MAG: NAD(P)-dependent oxidoreductase [Actinomycetota bacterium]|nr:NAD(P)-dependent oxidoreductase [Actinomycetota bacterium]